ncbi:MAG: 4-hydroxy-tetrahydrodipicolinate reductase [Clostridia bacterium]|nr:4-hydroxy-tetrahydrodipicolinate reductase [Clostridia bacterium]MBR4577728.1 4-hydroxy-tetrahydrodipicolinate reductase [Clostridia bacterium]
MRIILTGYTGHMGREVRACAEAAEGCEIVAGVDPMVPASDGICLKTFGECTAEADVIIDFSHHSMTKELLDFAEARKLPVVLATTGQTAEEKERIVEAAGKIPVFLAANYSLGIATLTDLVRRAAALYPDAEIEIVEQHHDRKLDAPSGTALALFNAVKEVRPEAEANCGRSGQGKRTKNEIGIHAIRMGNIVGVHEVMIGTQNERISLKHEAFSRGVFAEGSLKAAAFLMGKAPGIYDMKDLLRGV